MFNNKRLAMRHFQYAQNAEVRKPFSLIEVHIDTVIDYAANVEDARMVFQLNYFQLEADLRNSTFRKMRNLSKHEDVRAEKVYDEGIAFLVVKHSYNLNIPRVEGCCENNVLMLEDVLQRDYTNSLEGLLTADMLLDKCFAKLKNAMREEMFPNAFDEMSTAILQFVREDRGESVHCILPLDAGSDSYSYEFEATQWFSMKDARIVKNIFYINLIAPGSVDRIQQLHLEYNGARLELEECETTSRCRSYAIIKDANTLNDFVMKHCPHLATAECGSSYEIGNLKMMEVVRFVCFGIYEQLLTLLNS